MVWSSVWSHRAPIGPRRRAWARPAPCTGRATEPPRRSRWSSHDRSVHTRHRPLPAPPAPLTLHATPRRRAAGAKPRGYYVLAASIVLSAKTQVRPLPLLVWNPIPASLPLLVWNPIPTSLPLLVWNPIPTSLPLLVWNPIPTSLPLLVWNPIPTSLPLLVWNPIPTSQVRSQVQSIIPSQTVPIHDPPTGCPCHPATPLLYLLALSIAIKYGLVPSRNPTLISSRPLHRHRWCRHSCVRPPPSERRSPLWTSPCPPRTWRRGRDIDLCPAGS